MEQEINLKLSLDEINLIFKALGNRPFNEVFELIGNIEKRPQYDDKIEIVI